MPNDGRYEGILSYFRVMKYRRKIMIVMPDALIISKWMRECVTRESKYLFLSRAQKQLESKLPVRIKIGFFNRQYQLVAMFESCNCKSCKWETIFLAFLWFSHHIIKCSSLIKWEKITNIFVRNWFEFSDADNDQARLLPFGNFRFDWWVVAHTFLYTETYFINSCPQSL